MFNTRRALERFDRLLQRFDEIVAERSRRDGRGSPSAMPAPVEPPRGPQPLEGGAEAPLE